MIPAREALKLLQEGNRRFVSDISSRKAIGTRSRRIELAKSQAPFAAILGCSDSRVPVEIVFDQGLGDLFVIRVAGNIVAPSQIGSVEFVAERFKTRLVVYSVTRAAASSRRRWSSFRGPRSRGHGTSIPSSIACAPRSRDC